MGQFLYVLKTLSLTHLYYTIIMCINYEQRMKKSKTIN